VAFCEKTPDFLALDLVHVVTKHSDFGVELTQGALLTLLLN
jgi:hypothetical protein